MRILDKTSIKQTASSNLQFVGLYIKTKDGYEFIPMSNDNYKKISSFLNFEIMLEGSGFYNKKPEYAIKKK